jgi:hypothetical protein
MASYEERHPVLTGLLAALFGEGRAGRILYTSLFIVAVAAFAAWKILLPRLLFREQEEQLFRGARDGNVVAIERALGTGARVNAAAPIDGKTALFRAAVFGHLRDTKPTR